MTRSLLSAMKHLKVFYIYNFLDDTIPFVYNETLESVLDKLERNSELAIVQLKTII